MISSWIPENRIYSPVSMGKRGLLVFCVALLAQFTMAATITVTEPVSGAFLGRTNSLKFNITGSNQQVEVIVQTVNVANPSITFTTRQLFTPDADGKVQGTIPLNFNSSTPSGAYNITVTATEPGNFYNSPPIIPVTIDVEDPKFVNFNPVSGTFVKGIVPIIVELLEPNIDEWKVQVNGSDIPNNTGTSSNFTVTWDTALITVDGAQSVNVTVKDKAQNTKSQTISLTLDRIVPSSDILAPRSGDPIRPNSNITVVVNVTDQFQDSVDVTGIDVTAEHPDGTFIGRVARRSVSGNGNTVTWTGRILAERNFPRTFKLVVRATDRAGNSAVVQEVTLSADRGRGLTNDQAGIGGVITGVTSGISNTLKNVGKGGSVNSGSGKGTGSTNVGQTSTWYVLPGTTSTSTISNSNTIGFGFNNNYGFGKGGNGKGNVIGNGK